LTPRALAALDKALDNPDRAVHAAQVLLDRAWGKPPVAVYAQVHGAGPDGIVRYEFYWADAKTNTIPSEERAPTIDATADTNGDAEGEAEAQEVVIVWGDGTPVK
jgi:hypothetical protein